MKPIPFQIQIFKHKMKATLVAFLLFSSCLFALLDISNAGQAERLWEFINSRRESNSVSGGSSVLLDDKEVYLPVYVSPQDGLMEADKIVELPGQPEGVNFDQYAGYVTVDPKNGRSLFYYFVESPKDSDTKPLVLWLNGGPGCSSIGYGAMEELGPFRVNSDGKTLFRNDYAWNNVANVIFLESPAGVGFSYSNTTSDYDESGDKKTADDAYTFLINWFERFPQYKTRDFFITGESYAGHYVPQLAHTIIANNKITNRTVINLKGIAIGNAYVDDATTIKGRYDYFWTHALSSDESHAAIVTNCNFTNEGFTPICYSSLTKALLEVGSINYYNIYTPLCRGPPNGKNSAGTVKDFDPCSYYYTNSYLNLAEVQKALHANVTMLPYQWIRCSNSLTWNDAPLSILPTIKQLIESSMSVWMFSGDTDSWSSVTSTRYSINALMLPVENSWRPWYTNSEVGGYVVGYKGLTFVTVRGAGQQVPSNQPERALTMFDSFLQSKLPPSS